MTAKLCNTLDKAAAGMPTVTKSDTNLVISGLVDKLSDIKVKPHAAELLLTLSEARSPLVSLFRTLCLRRLAPPPRSAF